MTSGGNPMTLVLLKSSENPSVLCSRTRRRKETSRGSEVGYPHVIVTLSQQFFPRVCVVAITRPFTLSTR